MWLQETEFTFLDNLTPTTQMYLMCIDLAIFEQRERRRRDFDGQHEGLHRLDAVLGMQR